MHFSCRSFIATSSPESWSQYWENEPDDQQIFLSRGHLFALISLSSDTPDPDLKSLGRQIIDSINHHYFSPDKLQLPLSESLKEAVDKSLSLVDSSHTLSLQLLVTHKSTVYLATYNSGSILLSRPPHLSPLINSTDSEFSMLSGPLKDSDRYLLLTSSFIEKIGWDYIKQNLSIESIQSLEENFLSKLYSQSDQSLASAALVVIHSPAQPQESETLPPSTPPPSMAPTPPPFSPPPKATLSFPKINFSRSKNPVSSDLFVDSSSPQLLQKRRRLNIFIAIILLLALTFSSVFAYNKKQSEQREAKFQEIKTQIESKLTEANTVKGLSIDSAQELAKQASSLITDLSALEIHNDQILDLKSQVDSLLSLTGSSESFQPQSFYDTSLIFKDPSYKQIRLIDEKLYLFDSENHRLDSLHSSQKSTKNITQDDSLSNFSLFAYNQDIFYFLKSDSIFKLDSDSIKEVISLQDLDPSPSVIDMAFWNSSLYLLDSQNNTVWKVPPSASDFTTPQIWLKDDTLLDNPSSFAINGKIWVLSSSGLITPYLQGLEDNYKNPLPSSTSTASNLDTTLETDILAFSTADNQLFVLNKSGESIAKFNFDKLQILDLAIDENNKQIFVLCADQHIYLVDF